jgi:hypothetical protein
MLHLLKLYARPDSLASSHWRSEIRTFLIDAEDRFTPSMRQRIDRNELYAKALYLMREEIDANSEARPLPETCPFTLNELLGTQPDVAALVAEF